MFLIKKESNEYVEDGVFYSYETLYVLGIPFYAKVFTTQNGNVLQQFCGAESDQEESEYKQPVVVNGFKPE